VIKSTQISMRRLEGLNLSFTGTRAWFVYSR
jgi:hypothetical protein